MQLERNVTPRTDRLNLARIFFKFLIETSLRFKNFEFGGLFDIGAQNLNFAPFLNLVDFPSSRAKFEFPAF